MSKENGVKSDNKQGKPMDEMRPVEKRWTATRKQEVVLRLLRGEPIDALSRELGVESYRLAQWRDRALDGIEGAMRERQSANAREVELEAALKRIGELSMENELLRHKCRAQEQRSPLGRTRSPK
jgi:transposase